MKACVLHAVGDLRYEDVATPAPGPGEVLMRVRGCGVCGSDIPRIFNKGTYHFPTIPGHEFAGTITAVGKGADASLIGKLAAIFPLIPCRKCPQCETGIFELCVDYDYIGSRRDGAFAEYVAAPEWNVALAPEGVSVEEAAMTEPAAVALHALRRGGMAKGQTVAIYGAGPIGLLAAIWARALGAALVMLADIDDRKLEFARRLGFLSSFNAKAADAFGYVLDETNGGADLTIEATGANAALVQCIEATRPMGGVVLLGNPAEDVSLQQEIYWAILRKQLTLTGSWNSAYGVANRDDWATTLEYMASGNLDVKPLITHRVSLDRLNEALAVMRDGAKFTNKILCINP